MRKKYALMAAGFDHYQKALASLMDDETYEWDLSKAELIDELDLDARAYQYERAEYPLAILHEPGNKYDPAALQVFADDTMIGYVPRGNLATLRKLSEQPGLDMHVEIFGGPYKEIEYDEDEDYLGTMEPKYFKVRTIRAPFKAVMVFSWDA